MKIREGLTLRKVGADYLIVEPDQGMADLSKVYSLNDTAAFLWEQLNGRSFDLDIATTIMVREYGIDQITAKRDCKKIFTSMQEQNLFVE